LEPSGVNGDGRFENAGSAAPAPPWWSASGSRQACPR
jgi:hypothetical protein